MINQIYALAFLVMFCFCISCCVAVFTMDLCKVIPGAKWLPFCIGKGALDRALKGLGKGNLIDKKPEDCAFGDIFRRFRNESSKSRCVHFEVRDKDGGVYMGQKANNACRKAKFNVCVPKGGAVNVKGTTHMCGKKLRSGTLHYDVLQHHKPANDYVQAKHNACDNYGAFEVKLPPEGGTFRCWGGNCMPGGKDYKHWTNPDNY